MLLCRPDQKTTQASVLCIIEQTSRSIRLSMTCNCLPMGLRLIQVALRFSMGTCDAGLRVSLYKMTKVAEN
jgi:hypothetical protein